MLNKDHNEFIIDCGSCSLQGSEACADCVVTFILGPDNNTVHNGSNVVIDATEFFILRRLQAAGLVPELQHECESEHESDSSEWLA